MNNKIKTQYNLYIGDSPYPHIFKTKMECHDKAAEILSKAQKNIVNPECRERWIKNVKNYRIEVLETKRCQIFDNYGT